MDPECMDPTHHNAEKLFSTECNTCGSLTQYADDATYLTTDRTRGTNQRRMAENIENLKNLPGSKPTFS